ncbi:MAG: choice-of-anchor J domain-containing protein [Bacteroides sp.]|nr:choice-of-anchor J domain-containing protein [Bacteroides sp.]MCM1084789.1 choice-of-anchor J domain-containing protein [Bacteroides sp.]MCM1168997.1 choice-of-anchor J domain-containing protein [Bacteroides sp.]
MKNVLFKVGLCFFTTLCIVTLPLRAQDVLTLYGSLINNTSYGVDYEYGMYSFSLNGNGTITPVKIDNNLKADNGGVAVGGRYISCATSSNSLDNRIISHYDIESWELLKQFEVKGAFEVRDLAYDEVSGSVYGLFGDPYLSNCNLGTLDVNTGTVAIVGNIDKNLKAIACDNTGVVYVFDIEGDFYTLDPATLSITKKGNLGVRAPYASSAVFDPQSGKIYVTANAIDHPLIEVDPVKNESKKIYDLPKVQLVGLCLPMKDPAAGAPAVAEALKAEFSTGSKTGKVSFKMPLLTFSGEELSGEISYTLSYGEETPVTGTAAVGVLVEIPVTVETSGSYRFEVVLSNEAGESKKAAVSVYIGNDMPEAPAEATFSYDEATQKATVKWRSSKTSLNGGYFVAEDVTYKVIPEGSADVVYEGKDTLAVFDFPEPDDVRRCRFVVTASFKDAVSKPTLTNTINLGSVRLPFAENFSKPGALDIFTCLTVNPGSNNWELYDWYGDTCASVFEYDDAKDAWLITPPVFMEYGYYYAFSFLAASIENSYSESFEVWFGNEPTIEGMTMRLVDSTVLTTNDFVHVNTGVTVNKEGKYYFAIHAISPADQYRLVIDTLRLAVPVPNSTPDTVTDFTITPDREGALKADISFVAPMKCGNGDALESITKVEILRDETVLKTLTDVVPGATCVYTDSVGVSNGMHYYSVYAYNSEGVGRLATKYVYVGIKKPAPARNVRIRETEKDGEIIVTWESPETDIDGGYINPDSITYYVYTQDMEGNPVLVEENIKEKTVTHQAIAQNGEQDLVYYRVYAYTSAGGSEHAVSNLIPAGPALTLPWKESFPDATPENVCGNEAWPQDDGAAAAWQPVEDYATLESQDGDNGMAMCMGTGPGLTARLVLGKISLKESKDAVLSFWYYGSPESKNRIVANITKLPEAKDSSFEFVVGEDCETAGWKQVFIKLNHWAGSDIRLSFDAFLVSHNSVEIDNLSISNPEPSAVESPALVNIDIYPNPTTGLFYVDVPQKATVDILTAGGQTVMRETMTAGINTVSIKQSGVYLLRVVLEDGAVVARKLVVK